MKFLNATVTLLDGTVTNGGYWTALKASDGTVLWQTADPSGFKTISGPLLANEVLFGCSLGPTGNCVGMNTASGKILWRVATGGSNGRGIPVCNGRVYIGVGYDALEGIINLGNNLGKKVLMYSLPNQPADPPATGGGGGITNDCPPVSPALDGQYKMETSIRSVTAGQARHWRLLS